MPAMTLRNSKNNIQTWPMVILMKKIPPLKIDLQEDNANETEVKIKPKNAHACKHCDKSYTQSHNLYLITYAKCPSCHLIIDYYCEKFLLIINQFFFFFWY